jgi:hypothetical protein
MNLAEMSSRTCFVPGFKNFDNSLIRVVFKKQHLAAVGILKRAQSFEQVHTDGHPPPGSRLPPASPARGTLEVTLNCACRSCPDVDFIIMRTSFHI